MPPDEGAAPASAPNPELEAVAARIESGGESPTAAAGDAAGAELPRVESGMSRSEADALARMGLDWILDAACNQYPVLSYPEGVRARGAELAGAVLVKYDVLAWAGRWRAELELGMFLAGLVYGGYQQVQRAKAAPVSDQAAAGASGSHIS